MDDALIPFVTAVLAIAGTLTVSAIRRATKTADAAQDKTATMVEQFAEFRGTLSEGMRAMTAQVGRLDEVMLRVEGKISEGGEAVVQLGLKVREMDTRLEALETPNE